MKTQFRCFLFAALLVATASSSESTQGPIHHRGDATMSTSTYNLPAIPAQPSPLMPGDQAPGFSVQLLDGSWFRYSPTSTSLTPLIIMAYTGDDATNRAMVASNASVDAWLTTSPEATHYLFIAHAPTDAAACVETAYIQRRITDRTDTLKASGVLSKQRFDNWQTHVSFAAVSVSSLGGWVADTLADWTRPRNVLNLNFTDGTAPETVPRLDAHYTWLPYSTFTGLELTFAGTGCSSISENLTGKVAVLQQTLVQGSPECSFAEMVNRAQVAAAKAVVVVSAPSLPVQDMDCAGDECGLDDTISATMISYENARSLLSALEAGTAVFGSCDTEQVPGYFLAIDGEGKVQEVGWIKYPTLEMLSWEAQWFNYTTRLARNLTEASLVVPIMQHQEMHGAHGALASVQLPPSKVMESFPSLELDMALGCVDGRDFNCSIWDHTIQLFVCCEGSPSNLCNTELGRWISPFRRRVGRWLTPVTPLLPTLTSSASGKCNFTMKSPPWAGPWYPSLNLRFRKTPWTSPQTSPAQVGVPSLIVDLFRGGTFNASYNSKYQPVSFETPSWATKAVVYAVITGHGSDNNGCGEFCPTSHHFVVNDKYDNSVTFSVAGTPMGCADKISLGGIPNEHGTWVYGRDGWCDGADVKPHEWDITHQLVPPGSGNNTILYHGDFEGHTPDPTANPGYIIMYSRVVFFK